MDEVSEQYGVINIELANGRFGNNRLQSSMYGLAKGARRVQTPHPGRARVNCRTGGQADLIKVHESPFRCLT